MRPFITAVAFILISLIGIVFNILKLFTHHDNPKRKTNALLGILLFGEMFALTCGLILPLF